MEDANGQTIKIGDVVRICGIPDLFDMPPRTRKEAFNVFQHLVGTRKRISAIDTIGNVEFMFRLRAQGKTITHMVRIEPTC